MMDFRKFISKTLTFGGASEVEGEVFHIALGISKDYAAQAGVLMTSIVKCNTGCPLLFHIFCDVMAKEDLERVEAFAGTFEHISIRVYFINKDDLAHVSSSMRYPTAIYYRLIGAALLYNLTDRLLYLDSDMLCMGSLAPLAAATFEGVCMAVEDEGDWLPLHKQELGLPSGQRYFNSGVLYINTKKWHEARVSERAFELLAEREFSFPDQDALNLLVGNSYQPLSRKYNFFCSKCSEQDLPKETIFMHFAGDIKPWQPWDRGDLKCRWEACLRESLWAGYVYMPRTYQENRLMGRVLRQQGAYGEALRWYCRYVTDKARYKMELWRHRWD